MKKTLVSVVLALLLAATLCAANGGKKNAEPAPKVTNATTIDAWVSDDRCGANIDADCSRRCLQQGAKLVVVNTKDNSVIPVANQDSLKGFIAQHVTVTGTMKDGTLTVASVKPVKQG